LVESPIGVTERLEAGWSSRASASVSSEDARSHNEPQDAMAALQATMFSSCLSLNGFNMDYRGIYIYIEIHESYTDIYIYIYIKYIYIYI